MALEFRAAGVGDNGSGGPAGGALISTPVAIGNGTWDVKVVLGETPVEPDGSALFSVPARTPIYFQALDERGYAVQTMRSWATLQPGETRPCVGCHEHKNTAPPTQQTQSAMAFRRGVRSLEPFFGPARGFSFQKEIQPILNRHCVGCHKDRTRYESARENRPGPGTGQGPVAFSLLPDPVIDVQAKRRWSDAYLALTQARGRNGPSAGFQGNPDGPWVKWISSQSVPALLSPYFAGAARSPLMDLLIEGHGAVALSREELEKIACWIDLLVPFSGDFLEANAWTEEETAKYVRYSEKRHRMKALEDGTRTNSE